MSFLTIKKLLDYRRISVLCTLQKYDDEDKLKIDPN